MSAILEPKEMVLLSTCSKLLKVFLLSKALNFSTRHKDIKIIPHKLPQLITQLINLSPTPSKNSNQSSKVHHHLLRNKSYFWLCLISPTQPLTIITKIRPPPSILNKNHQPSINKLKRTQTSSRVVYIKT